MDAQIPRLLPGAYFGQPPAGQTTALPDDRLALREYPSDSIVPAHEHERGHFCFVMKGTYRERVEGVTVTRRPCDLLWHPAGAVHSERHHGSGRHLLCEPVRERGSAISTEPLRIDAADACELGPRLVLLAVHGGDGLDLESVLCELEAIVQGVDDPARVTPDWLDAVEDCVRDRFREPIGLAELADEASVSSTHLARVWRRRHGRTIGESVRRLRIAWAVRQLTRSGRSLTEIALDAGFADLAHFSRSFRAQTGCSPSSYRALLSA